jgi:hypothetical protein
MKTKSFALGLTTVAAAVIMPVTAFAGYAPSSRATFTCASPTSCDGATYVTFNSFTNAPNYGDERAFFDVKDAANTASGGYADSMKVVDGQKLTVRVYIHNDANPAAIGVANATAKNTKLQIQLPTSKKTSATAAADISADNANPGTISDTIDLTGDNPFTLAFDKTGPVNITYRPNGQGDFVTRALPSASFANDSTLNADFGDWHGCFEYSAIVTANVVVHMPTTPKPPVTPPTTTTTTPPTKLVNTGAGSVIGIFAAATAAGAAAYRFVLGRRLSRQ